MAARCLQRGRCGCMPVAGGPAKTDAAEVHECSLPCSRMRPDPCLLQVPRLQAETGKPEQQPNPAAGRCGARAQGSEAGCRLRLDGLRHDIREGERVRGEQAEGREQTAGLLAVEDGSVAVLAPTWLVLPATLWLAASLVRADEDCSITRPGGVKEPGVTNIKGECCSSFYSNSGNCR